MGKKIKISCKGADSISLNDLEFFQGDLKTLSKENYEKLRSRILQRGFSFPFFVWKDNGTNWIMDGHHRFLVLKDLEKEGYEIPGLPVAYIEASDLKEAKAKLLELNSNYAKISADGFLNFTADLDLNDLLINIDLPDFDIPDMVEPEIIEGQIDDDEVPEVKHDPITKRGDVWILGGKHRVMCGDSTMIDDVEKLMNGEKADVVFTSPPYNANAKTGDGDIFSGRKSKKMYEGAFVDNMDSDSYIQFAKDVLNICFAFTNGFIFWNVSYNKKSRYEYIKQIENKIEHLIEQICWKKSSTIPFKGSLMRDWEPVYLFSTNKKTLGLDKVTSNFWDINNTNSQGENHKACFPVALPEKGISLIADSKLCFEPFCGSGSTLIACEKTNRKCYGMELDEHYCDVVINRYMEFTGKDDVILESTGEKYIELRP